MSDYRGQYRAYMNYRKAEREAEIKLVDDACDQLNRQADHLAETTRFGAALRAYVDGICGVHLTWSQK